MLRREEDTDALANASILQPEDFHRSCDASRMILTATAICQPWSALLQCRYRPGGGLAGGEIVMQWPLH